MEKRFQSAVERFAPIPVLKSQTSETVPDMSFTPREIISKFSRGERVPLGFQGLYDDDDASPFDDDPTRDPAFDFGDYVEEKHALEEREAERSRRSQASARSDSKRKASGEELSASDAMSRETASVEAEPGTSGQSSK